MVLIGNQKNLQLTDQQAAQVAKLNIDKVKNSHCPTTPHSQPKTKINEKENLKPYIHL